VLDTFNGLLEAMAMQACVPTELSAATNCAALASVAANEEPKINAVPSAVVNVFIFLSSCCPYYV
jgi:hypothetical protein